MGVVKNTKSNEARAGEYAAALSVVDTTNASEAEAT